MQHLRAKVWLVWLSRSACVPPCAQPLLDCGAPALLWAALSCSACRVYSYMPIAPLTCTFSERMRPSCEAGGVEQGV